METAEPPGAMYLYTVALVAITFVGFTMLSMTLRQVLGGKVTPFDILLMHNHLQINLSIVGAALLAPLLALLHLSEQMVWIGSGVLGAIPLLLFCALYPERRKKATGGPMPLGTKLILAIWCLGAALMLFNAVGWPPRPRPGVFALGLTIVLFGSFWAFIYALQFLLTPTEAAPVLGVREPTRAEAPGRAGA